MTGRPWTDETLRRAREAFLTALASGASVTKACEAAGIGRATAYLWREGDAAFAAAWTVALEGGADLLEDEARRRAVDGVEKPVVAMGKVAKNDDGSVLKVREYSDTLLAMLLKAKRPGEYRERHVVDANITGKVELEHSADADFLAFAAALGGAAARPAGGAGDDGGMEGEGSA